MSNSDEVLYKAAMSRVDDLVDEVFQIINEVAEENHYSKDWVLERFREKFNKAKRSFLDY